jgi:hypothetical protein
MSSLHRAFRRGLTLEHGIQAAIVCTVIGAVLAAGSVLPLLTFGRRARWLALVVLAALAVVYAARRAGTRSARELLWPGAAAAAFLLAAFASVTWSATPGLTFGRAGAFALVVLAATALAVGAAPSTTGIRRAVDGVVYAVGAVALGGLIVLAVDSDRAIDPATSQTQARYQGLGGGPNTATMVLAVGTPLAVDAFLRARTLRGRLAAGGLAAVVIGSIVASDSRGSLLGAFTGLAVYGVLRERIATRRLLAGAAAVAAFVVGVLLMRIPDPLPPGAASRRGYIPPTFEPSPIVANRPFGDANLLLRLQDDVGHPRPGVGVEDVRRGLFGTSGRAQAWEGALEQGAERPVAGHGFGTEDKVFVDRYVSFNSNVPENSYVGLFLQLGAVGLAAFAVLAAVMLAVPARVLTRLEGERRHLAAACTGAFAAGLVLALFQSYVYAAGNNATAVLWISGFLACAAVVPDVAAER